MASIFKSRLQQKQQKVRNEVPSGENSIFESRHQKVPMPVQIVGVTVLEVSTTVSGDELPRLVVRVVTDDDIPLSSPIKDLTR